MSRDRETAVELRRLAGVARLHADRLDRMAGNLEAGRPLAEGFGQVVVLDAETGDRCSWEDVAGGSATSSGATGDGEFVDLEVP